jgi:hypothetical protein
MQAIDPVFANGIPSLTTFGCAFSSSSIRESCDDGT